MSKVVKIAAKVGAIVATAAMLASGAGALLLAPGMTFAFAGVASGTIAGVAGAFAAGAGLLMGKPKGGMPEQVTALPPRLMVNGVVRRGDDNWQIAGHQEQAGMPPIRSRWHWKRWAMHIAKGDCLVPILEEGEHLVLIDRHAQIRPGDLVSFEITREHGGMGMIKRFKTATPDTFVFETTNPTVESYIIPRAAVTRCYRVRRYLAGADQFREAVREIEGDETLHNERLGRTVFPKGFDFRTYSLPKSETVEQRQQAA